MWSPSLRADQHPLNPLSAYGGEEQRQFICGNYVQLVGLCCTGKGENVCVHNEYIGNEFCMG